MVEPVLIPAFLNFREFVEFGQVVAHGLAERKGKGKLFQSKRQLPFPLALMLRSTILMKRTALIKACNSACEETTRDQFSNGRKNPSISCIFQSNHGASAPS
jgi:hypothetical protein